MISSGQIQATHMANTGGYMISREQLVLYLKSRKEWTKFKKSVQPKAIVVEPDFNKGLMIKAELERGASARAVCVPGAKDLAKELEKSGADIIALHLMDELALDAETTALLQKARQEHEARLVIFHQKGADLLDRKPEIKKQFEELGVTAVVFFTVRLQPVMDKIKEILAAVAAAE